MNKWKALSVSSHVPDGLLQAWAVPPILKSAMKHDYGEDHAVLFSLRKNVGVENMVYEKVLCPYCKSDKVVRYGKNNTRKQRMMYQNPECSHKTFQLEYSNNASKPETKEKIIDMAMNGSGTREYKYLDELLKLLSEFHIGMVYANNNFAYSSRISPDKLVTGKSKTACTENDLFFQKRGNSQSCDRNFYKYILFWVCF